MEQIADHVVVAVLFTDDLTRVVTGYSKKNNCRRLITLNAKDDHEDGIRGELLKTLSRMGVGKEHIQIVEPLEKRLPMNANPRKVRTSVIQHPFLVILQPDVVLRSSLKPLDDIRARPTVTTLSAWKKNPGSKIEREGLTLWSDDGDKNRTNPYHAICIAQALIRLRELCGAGDEFRPLHTMLDALKERGVDIDTCIDEISTAMQQRKV
jgi:hypothetical protein